MNEELLVVEKPIIEIVEMEEPGAANAVQNLRRMYQGCMDTQVKHLQLTDLHHLRMHIT